MLDDRIVFKLLPKFSLHDPVHGFVERVLFLARPLDLGISAATTPNVKTGGNT
jgi:hypothetical protein